MAQILSGPIVYFSGCDVTTSGLTGSGTVKLTDFTQGEVGTTIQGAGGSSEGISFGGSYYTLQSSVTFDPSTTVALEGPTNGVITASGKVNGQDTTVNFKA